jgi:cyclohexadieny/prephenate dehydrogenase
MPRQSPPLFKRVAIIGLGLIGSSLARLLRQDGFTRTIVACDASPNVRAKVADLKLADEVTADAAAAVRGADLVVICTPMSSFFTLGPIVGKNLKKGAILSDVGSVKQTAFEALAPHVRKGAHLIPAHPVAGTENSGPEAGFAGLFAGRWCIVTPPENADRHAVARVSEMWRRAGMQVEIMTAQHHDRVLAITSHVPHLIAYTIVNTVSDLESHMRGEVMKFAAGGFRDFTRVAASDPIMWRDVFLHNREAVLEMLGRLYEDIALMQKAIRHGEGEKLQAVFARARQIRRALVQAKQA